MNLLTPKVVFIKGEPRAIVPHWFFKLTGTLTPTQIDKFNCFVYKCNGIARLDNLGGAVGTYANYVVNHYK